MKETVYYLTVLGIWGIYTFLNIRRAKKNIKKLEESIEKLKKEKVYEVFSDDILLFSKKVESLEEEQFCWIKIFDRIWEEKKKILTSKDYMFILILFFLLCLIIKK